MIGAFPLGEDERCTERWNESDVSDVGTEGKVKASLKKKTNKKH